MATDCKGSGCKFTETLAQIVSTSLKVPIRAGAPPPRYPGDKPVDGSDEDTVDIGIGWDIVEIVFAVADITFGSLQTVLGEATKAIL